MQATRQPRDGKQNAPGVAAPEASSDWTSKDRIAPRVPTEAPPRNPAHMSSGEPSSGEPRARVARPSAGPSRARELTLTPLALFFSAREAAFFGPGYQTESSATPLDALEARALAEGADGVLAACAEGVEPGRVARAVVHALEPWAAAGADVDADLAGAAQLLTSAKRLGAPSRRFAEALERKRRGERGHGRADGPAAAFVASVAELFLLEEDAADCDANLNDVTHIVALQLVGAAARFMAADQVRLFVLRVLEALAEERLLGTLATRPVALAAERRSA